jgi:hypothetical protein
MLRNKRTADAYDAFVGGTKDLVGMALIRAYWYT